MLSYWIVLKFYPGGDVQTEIDTCRETRGRSSHSETSRGSWQVARDRGNAQGNTFGLFEFVDTSAVILVYGCIWQLHLRVLLSWNCMELFSPWASNARVSTHLSHTTYLYIHIYRIYTYLTNDVKGKVGISSSWLSWLGPSWLMLAVSSGKLVDPVEPVEPGMTWSCPWAK